MGVSLLAAVTAAALVTAGVAPAASTPAPPSCAWRESAVRLHAALPAGGDGESQWLRDALAAAGVGSSDFLAGCGSTPASAPSRRAPAAAPSDPCPTTPGARPYFPEADWLWDPIPADAALDPGAAQMSAALADGDHILNTGDFGVTLVTPDEIGSDAPRTAVPLSEDWGPDPLAGLTVPVPPGLEIPPGSDAHVAIADPQSGTVVNLWGARRSGDGLAASWGAATPIDGDGRETNGSSTGAGIARYAAVVRASEIADGEIPHALFFSTNVAAPDEVRYPATKTDGSNMDGSGAPIPEGARVQLDPAIDVDAIPGIGKGEAAIAKALQRYGAYVGDNGGARMAFMAEYSPDSGVYDAAGLPGDYVALGAIPWDRLRVLSDWSGGSRTEPTADTATAQERSVAPACAPPAAAGAPTRAQTSTAAPAPASGPTAARRSSETEEH
jgi:hypothetical protein